MLKIDQIIEFFSTKLTKQKDTFFKNSKFGLFGDFLKLEVFPEENPIQKLANSLGPRRNWQKKFQVRKQIWLFWPEIVKILKKIIK